MSDDIKVYVHNYGPYVGEKIIINCEEYEISLDFESLPKLIKDLQEIEKNLEYYLNRDKIKNTMLIKMWNKRDRNPSKEKEIKEEYQDKIMKFYEGDKSEQ